ncbi:MAG: glycosyltransferase family 87 protein, partial [Rhodomicrobium sp.]
MPIAGKPGRILAAGGIILSGLVLLGAIFDLSLTEQSAATRDFIGYWAAGQQIVHGSDPYNADQVLQLEKAVGLGNLQIKITPSPPIGLALVLPLGFLSAKSGLVLWMLVELACLSLSLWVVWQLEGKPSSRLHLLGYLFAPALACFMAGQIGIFLLLGLSLFLLWHETRPFLAGAALLPMTPKPHLFLPIALVLLLWTILRRRPSIFAGLLTAMAASFALVLAFDPHAWSQYSAMLHSNL